MALPKEPRQKMINVMYLVLTALLALNVSSEVLNAFRTMDKSFSNASAVIDNKTNTIFSSFESKLKDPKTSELASIWKPKADKAKQLSDELVAYIEDLKTKIKNEAGSSGDHFNEKNTNAPTKIMVDETSGKELLKRLTEYKNNILSIDPKIEAQFKNSFPLDLSMPPVQNKSNNTWEAAYFRRTPALAAITILSKFQSDIKNAEAQVVEYCHNQIGEVQVVYDEFQALATANSQVLYPGSEFTITAGVGAFSKNAKPSVTIDGVQVPLNENGLAEYKTVAGNPGSYTKKVNVSFVKPDGTTATLTKDIQYVVAAPTGLTVSADAVKVLYVGLDNPISIGGGSGTNASNLKVSISQGTITGSNGRYIARVTTPGTATITVNDGKKTTSFDFRVKTVPTPTAMVGNSRGGRMRVNDFKAQSGVRAELENFVFEGVKFTVTSYTITFAGAGYPEFMYKAVSGNSFAPARSLIERAQPGSTITIDEIRAVGPGGPRTLAPIAFNLY
ncbi:gliding motility protein GldM [Niabella digestorum]|uniref:Gliding motility protein GldM n=1 Tax=Niabella digestorum TaxID=3117701 RepID=A0ABU7RI69_9BACT